jgi:hypothetical protein
MDNYVINEKGEKVIGPSRRPDGTLRKERRVRAGYTPQDEQPAYMSVGAAVRNGSHRAYKAAIAPGDATLAAGRPVQCTAMGTACCPVAASGALTERAACTAHPPRAVTACFLACELRHAMLRRAPGLTPQFKVGGPRCPGYDPSAGGRR